MSDHIEVPHVCLTASSKIDKANVTAGAAHARSGLFIQNTAQTSRGGHEGAQRNAVTAASSPRPFQRPFWHGILQRFLERCIVGLTVLALACGLVTAHKATQKVSYYSVSK